MAAPLHVHSAAIFACFIFALLLLACNPVSGNIDCEELPIQKCAFAVATSGARCVLEKYIAPTDETPEYKCQTSVILAERPVEWIETDECIKSCGLQRLSVGLSTDGLHEREFTTKLCLSDCRSKCPNINDLYTKLAEEEGINLASVCESLKPKPRRLISSTPQITTSARNYREEATTSSDIQALAPSNNKEQPNYAPGPEPTSPEAPAPSPEYVAEPYPAVEPPVYGEAPLYAPEPSPYYEQAPSPYAEEPSVYAEEPSTAEIQAPYSPAVIYAQEPTTPGLILG